MRALLAAAALALPRGAAACAVCFGDSPQARGLFNGLFWGIVLLLAVTFTLVGGIAWGLRSVEKARGESDA